MNKMAMVSEGDLATVDMNVVRHEDARRGMGLGHWLKVVRDTVRMGDGKVRVERIRGVDADVVADGGGAIMGPVTVPLGALRKANMSSKSAADSEVVFHAFSRGGRWELVGYADGKYEDLKHGKVTGSGGAFSRMGLAHKLAAMVQDSKIMDGINYIIDVDRLGVKQLLSKIDPSKVAPAEFYRVGGTMNKIAVAKELLAIARELQAIEFPTQDAYDKYMKDHPDADKSNHSVKKTQEKAPAKRENVPSKSEHTHHIEKGTDIRVYHDDKDYTVVVMGKDWDEDVSPGMSSMFSLGEGWSEGKEGSHLGKPVKFGDLDEDTKRRILQRLK